MTLEIHSAIPNIISGKVNKLSPFQGEITAKNMTVMMASADKECLTAVFMLCMMPDVCQISIR
jgi:hypothetical protein